MDPLQHDPEYLQKSLARWAPGAGREQTFAPFDGIVIGHNNLPLAHEGDALFNVAAFKSVSLAEDMLAEFSAEHRNEELNT